MSHLIRTTKVIVATLCCWLMVSGPAIAQNSDFLSDDVLFDAPNPFAENLENQGVDLEFDIRGDFKVESRKSRSQQSGSAVRPSPSESMQSADDPDNLNPEDESLLMVAGMAQAKQLVLGHGCTSGGNLNRCMQIKALMPGFKDSGWTVRIAADGNYLVERVLLLNGTLPLRYSWNVAEDGAITPATMRAELITASDY